LTIGITGLLLVVVTVVVTGPPKISSSKILLLEFFVLVFVFCLTGYYTLVAGLDPGFTNFIGPF
jgi:hypothetical protein